MKKVIIRVLYGVCVCGLVIMYGRIIDKEFNNGKVYNKIIYGSDCNFIVPNGYKITYSIEEKQYAVAVLTYPDYYLYTSYNTGVTTMFSSITQVSKFDDSCAAKGYLKAYLRKIEPTMTTYK